MVTNRDVADLFAEDDVEDVHGRRYWLFRHGLYDEKPDPRWYIHGVFA